MARIAPLLSCAAVIGFAACVDHPDPASLAPTAHDIVELAQPVQGSYDLKFLDPVSRAEIQNQQFGSGVILQATVSGASGPAQSGVVVFQYCSLKGYPENDTTRIDEAPLEECDVTREGAWQTLATYDVNASGIAEYFFCCPRFTPSIGFRYKYQGRGSGIMNWTVSPENFFWI